MTTFQVRPPAAEPVTLAQARAFLRIDGSDEDEVVAGLIRAACRYVETETRRALMAQGWRTVVAGRALRRPVTLSPGPLIAVSAVTAYDAGGTPAVLAAGQWRLETGAAAPAVVLSPEAARHAVNGVEIDFDAGFGSTAEAVPQPLIQALLMLVAHWYEHREAVALGVAAGAVALGVAALTAPYRAVRL